MNDTIEIYSRNMAIYLRRLGFKILSTEVNPYNPEFDMWIFEDSHELRDAMGRYNKAQ